LRPGGKVGIRAFLLLQSSTIVRDCAMDMSAARKVGRGGGDGAERTYTRGMDGWVDGWVERRC